MANTAVLNVDLHIVWTQVASRNRKRCQPGCGTLRCITLRLIGGRFRGLNFGYRCCYSTHFVSPEINSRSVERIRALADKVWRSDSGVVSLVQMPCS